jgi:hypothetical protein
MNHTAGTQETRDRTDQIIRLVQKRLDDKQLRAMRKKLSDQSLNEIVSALLA